MTPNWPSLTVSPEISREAQRRGLGSVRQAHRTYPKLPTGPVFIVCLAGVFGLLSIVLAIAARQPWPLVLLLGPVVMAVIARRALLLNPVMWFWICDNGFLYQQAPSPLTACAWVDVESVRRLDVLRVFNGIPAGTNRSTYIKTTEGKLINLSGEFPQYLALSEQVVRRVSEARLPVIAALIDAGESVAFGSFSLDHHGVGFDGRHLGWPDVQWIGLDRDTIQVLRHGQHKPWVSERAWGLPNMPIFLTLANALWTAHQREERP